MRPQRPEFLAVVLALSALTGTAALGAGTQADDSETCLSCHGDKDLSVKLPDGAVQTLFVDRNSLGKSVHGSKLACADCHADQKEFPHPERNVKTQAEFSAGFRELCKACHFDNYTKAVDGVHYKQLAKGDTSAPFCIDCHGSHGITKPNEPRTKISETCSACHSAVSDVFAQSVHGRALIERGSPDVPVCTDCHKSHDIANPKSRNWRLHTLDTCGGCHTDKKMMAKYGLSTNVLQSYLKDFHGMTASLYKGQKAESTGVIVICVDCHGAHDITKTREAGSRVLKANLVTTCRKCHVNATDSFPAAWLSHYEPSWKKAPLVYAVSLFYKVFIPFIIGGLVLQILLHLWRVVVNR